MNNALTVGVAGLIIGVLLGSFALPRVWPGMMGYGGNGGVPGAGMSANIDRHFIEEMIPHHEGAIAMGELAMRKGESAEIRMLGNAIADAQMREVEQMREWYQEWFGATVPTDSTGAMGGMGHGAGMRMGSMEGDMEALAAAKDFDLEFIRQMIPHHEMAVMMARMLAAGSERSEMQTLADNIITSQTREIGMMQSWYQAWQ